MAAVTPRNLDFDVLRAGAILFVVGFRHIDDYSPFFSTSSVFADIMIDCILGIFTFISSHLLASRHEIRNSADAAAFYKKRFLRIYPMYFITLTLFLTMDLTDLSTYFQSVFLINMITGKPLLTLWYITMIVLFYLVFPFYMLNDSVRKTIGLTVAFYIFLIAVNQFTDLIEMRFTKFLPAFGLGLITGRSPAVMRRMGTWKAVSFSVPVCIFGIILYLTVDKARILFSDMIILSSLPVFLVLAGKISGFIRKRYILWMSYASFGLYLVHRIVFKIGIAIYDPKSLLTSVLYLFLCLLPLSVISGYSFQFAYDSALTKINRKLR